MSKVVTYISSTYLPCACNADNEIVICLNSSDLVAAKTCPGTPLVATEHFPFTTIDASITQCLKMNNGCGSPVYQYSLTYDETQLADPTTPIISSQITGVFCKNCLTNWTEESIGNEPYIKDNGDGTVSFVSPHDCEYQIVTASTIDEVSKLLCNTVSPQTYAELLTDVAAGHNLCICVPLTLTGNLTLSVGLSFSKGGLLTTNGFTLTINGPFYAGIQQCFDATTGNVVFGSHSTDYLIPEWWGAKGDGTTDDTTPIQKCLTASTGTSVILSPVTYKITSPLAMAANSRLIGSGYDKTTIYQATANTSQINVNNDNEVAYIKFTGTGNINLLGNEVIFFDPVGSGLIGKRCWVHHNYLDSTISTSGIGGNNMIDVWIEDNIIDLGVQGEHGVYISGGSDRVWLARNKITRTGVAATASIRAVHLKGASNLHILDNEITGTWNSYGITFNDFAGSGIIIEGNRIEISYGGPFYPISLGQATTLDGVLVKGNYIKGGTAGIWGFAKNMFLTGNYIRDTAYGIDIDGTTGTNITDCTIKGNYIYGAGTGIRVQSGQAGFVCAENTLQGVAGVSTGIGISINSGVTDTTVCDNYVRSFTTGYAFNIAGMTQFNNFYDNTLWGGAVTGLTASGVNLAGSLALSNEFNDVTSVGAGTGVHLPLIFPIGKVCWVRNASGVNALNVYPPDASGTINSGGAGTAVSVATNTLNPFVKVTATNWIGIEFAVAVA